MPNNTTITPDQLRTVLFAAELANNPEILHRFSYAEKGASTQSFGVMQFDVGKNNDAQHFLRENGFTDDDIKILSTHGKLPAAELHALDSKLQAIPQEKMDLFTNQQLNKKIVDLDAVIDRVREKNPAAAEAIAKDPKLQLSIADYENQFGSVGPQLVGFLAGKPEKLQGGIVQADNPPTREDILKFVHATKFGQDPSNAKAIAGRIERFDGALHTLNLSGSPQARGHAAMPAQPAGHAKPVAHDTSQESPNAAHHHVVGDVLREGIHDEAVRTLQAHLAKLGYKDGHGHPLKADGAFGIDTRHAVERFQHNNHLTVDGIAGPKTLEAIHYAQAKHAAPSLADPKNPDHALYEQARAAVHHLDASMGRTSDKQSDQLAASLVVAAKRERMTSIDTVVLSEDGSRAFAVQGRPDSPQRQIAHVPTAEAVNTPIDKSSAAAHAVNQQQAQQQQPTQPSITAQAQSAPAIAL